MKSPLAVGLVLLAFGVAVPCQVGCAQQGTNAPLAPAVPTAPLAPSALSSAGILEQSRKVSEAQLNSLAAQKRNPLDWIGGTMWIGVAEFGRVSQRPLEAQAILGMGEKAGWKPLVHEKSPFHADDDCIGQAFLEAYGQQGEGRLLQPLQKDMDALVEHLHSTANDKTNLTWSWCDALFMAPPVLTRMTNLTGDRKYLDAMDKEWWKVTDALYDPQEHLFYRDKRFLPMKTKNGKKVFWSRGNGWVFAGLARILTWMPKDYPTRPRYEQLFRDMAAKLLTLQGADGAWRTSLLDAEELPMPESSGTAFYCYGMAWGINQGLLPRATYAPTALKAWTALMNNVRPDGLPGWVQLVGDRPGKATADGTQLYATGGILLAGTELSKLVSGGPQLEVVTP